MGYGIAGGYGSAFFFGLSIFKFRSLKFGAKIALSAVFPGFCCKFRPLKNTFQTLQTAHSMRHQTIPPLSAGREKFQKQGIIHRIRNLKRELQQHFKVF